MVGIVAAAPLGSVARTEAFDGLTPIRLGKILGAGAHMVRQSALQFVTEAELPDTRDIGVEMKPVQFDPAREQSVVVGPQLFSFLKGVTPARRQAVASSSLFAALVADAQAPRTDVERWSALHSGALTTLGWVPQESTRREFDQANFTSQVHEAVIDVAEAFAIGGTALVLIKAALSAVQKASDATPWFALFDRQTRRETLSGFQLGLVDSTSDGEFQVKFMAFNLQLSRAVTQVLLLKFGAGAVHMDTIANTYTIAEDVLLAAMPKLVQRLSKYVSSYVADAELPPLP